MTFTAPQDGTTATVVAADLMVCSGIVHAVDAVLVRGSDMAMLEMPPAVETPPAPVAEPVAAPVTEPVAAPDAPAPVEVSPAPVDNGMADLEDAPASYGGSYGGAYGGSYGGAYGGTDGGYGGESPDGAYGGAWLQTSCLHCVFVAMFARSACLL